MGDQPPPPSPQPNTGSRLPAVLPSDLDKRVVFTRVREIGGQLGQLLSNASQSPLLAGLALSPLGVRAGETDSQAEPLAVQLDAAELGNELQTHALRSGSQLKLWLSRLPSDYAGRAAWLVGLTASGTPVASPQAVVADQAPYGVSLMLELPPTDSLASLALVLEQ